MNELLIVAGLLLGGLVASELGYRIGIAVKRTDDALGKQLDVIRASTLALVAFLVAFAFSGAAGRFVDRLDMIVSEANALGTAWLRADVLPEPQRAELKATVKEDTADRVTILSSHDRDEMVRLLAKVGGLQERMWPQPPSRGRRAMRPRWNPGAAAAERGVRPPHRASRSGNPAPAAADPDRAVDDGGAFPGAGRRRHGRSERRFPLLDAIYATVLAVALWMTIDLDRPRQGIIQISSQPLADTLAAMK